MVVGPCQQVADCHDGIPQKVRSGTIDKWILYQQTGTPSSSVISVGNGSGGSSGRSDIEGLRGGNVSGLFLTDVSNATFGSRCCSTWCAVPVGIKPGVCHPDEAFDGIKQLEGVPVSAILDQLAAL
jgi:hypothetical protein